MGGKSEDSYGKHGRPCFYCFEYNNIYWLVPISSRLEKFRKIYNDKMEKYKGEYDGIRFGFVNGKERAFLIQNLCPVTDEYIDCEYKIEKDTVPVTINPELSKELNGIVRKVVRLYYEKDVKITMTDIKTIMHGLKSEMKDKATKVYHEKISEINSLTNREIAMFNDTIKDYQSKIDDINEKIKLAKSESEKNLTIAKNEYNAEIERIDNM